MTKDLEEMTPEECEKYVVDHLRRSLENYTVGEIDIESIKETMESFLLKKYEEGCFIDPEMPEFEYKMDPDDSTRLLMLPKNQAARDIVERYNNPPLKYYVGVYSINKKEPE